MNAVLVDTSVWVEHFRRHDDALADLLALDQVLSHPMMLLAPASRLWTRDKRLAQLAVRFRVSHQPALH